MVPSNPPAAVRGPKHVVYESQTPILTEEDARKLFESIDTSTVICLRDRALIAVMVYTFARIEAALLLKVGDYFAKGKRWWLRLHEKNGKVIQMPAHHKHCCVPVASSLIITGNLREGANNSNERSHSIPYCAGTNEV